MYSYYFRAVKNYKDTFQLMRIIKIERFNSRLYFYCVNRRINPLTVNVLATYTKQPPTRDNLPIAQPKPSPSQSNTLSKTVIKELLINYSVFI